MRALTVGTILFTGTFGTESWMRENVEFSAVNENLDSRYWLKGKYGPARSGQYAYIYLEVGGDEIDDGAVVATWATITNPDFTLQSFETVECAAIYKQDGQIIESDINVRTYTGRYSNFEADFTGEIEVWSTPI